jgi:hypothetical protein
MVDFNLTMKDHIHGLVAKLWFNNEYQYPWHLMNFNYAPHAYT